MLDLVIENFVDTKRGGRRLRKTGMRTCVYHEKCETIFLKEVSSPHTARFGEMHSAAEAIPDFFFCARREWKSRVGHGVGGSVQR